MHTDSRRLRAPLFTLLAALLLASPVAAQPGTHVAGQVVDSTGAPLAGARVSTPAASTVTDADGRFLLGTDGPTRLHVERPRFRSVVVAVPEGERAPLRVVLEVAPLSEHVVVVPPIVDATTFDAFGSSQTVVSSSQVADLNALDLASALRRTPGVTISRFNPVGSFGGAEGGSVHVRGMGASRPGSEIKTYVDGVPFYMGLWNHPLLDLLPVDGIDRITVLKGPQPQTFGDAFSAVAIDSARATSDGFAASLRVSGGSFGTVAEQALATGRFGAWELVASQGFARSDGHRDDARGRIANAAARIGYRWNDSWAIDARVMRVGNTATDPGEVGLPATRNGRYDTSGTLLAAAVSHHFTAAQGAVQVYRSSGTGNWLDQRPPDEDTLTQFSMTGVRWRERWRAWDRGTVSGGLTLDRVDGNAQFHPAGAAASSAFDGTAFMLTSPHVAVDHTLALPAGWHVTPSAGVRHYSHSVFADAIAPHAGVVAQAPWPLALRANYARGVHYPGQEVAVLSTLIPPLGTTWRSLDAETLDHVEVGVMAAPAASTTVDFAWFNDRRDNRYVFAFPPAVARPMFLNVGSYRVQGAEFSVQQRIASGWQAFGGLTLLNTSIEGVPYTPKATLALGVTGRVGRLRLAMDLQSQSAMEVFGRARNPAASDLARVKGFTVVNVRPSYRLPVWRERVDAFVAIENLFDRAYAFRPGYPMPGTSVQVGVAITGT